MGQKGIKTTSQKQERPLKGGEVRKKDQTIPKDVREKRSRSRKTEKIIARGKKQQYTVVLTKKNGRSANAP